MSDIVELAVEEYRVCHDLEYQTQWRGIRAAVPEVFHFDMSAPTKLTKPWQELIMALNPGMPAPAFRSLLKHDRAFCNKSNGFDYKDVKRADFINGIDLGAKPPINDKCRCCGGAILRGKRNGDLLKIETLDGSKPPPSIEWLRARPWLYFRCYTIRPDGTLGDFPQNGGKPVYMPLVATGSVTVRIGKIVKGKPYPLVMVRRR